MRAPGALFFVGTQLAVAWARRGESFAYNTFVIEQDEGQIQTAAAACLLVPYRTLARL